MDCEPDRMEGGLSLRQNFVGVAWSGCLGRLVLNDRLPVRPLAENGRDEAYLPEHVVLGPNASTFERRTIACVGSSLTGNDPSKVHRRPCDRC